MDEKFSSFTDVTKMRNVVLSSESQVPPACFEYSRNGSGIPFIHGVEAVM